MIAAGATPTPQVRSERSSATRRLNILQHSLGLDEYGHGRQYRNHFCTGPGSADFDDCNALVNEGLMTRRPGSELSGGSDIFLVTPAGVDFVARNSPTRPPEAKLSRSQKNYRRYLDADCGISFGEWIRLNRTSS